MKRMVCLLLALLLCAACCRAEESRTFVLCFDEGFSLRLPEGWVSYPAAGEDVRYALGDGSGARYLYILAQPTPLEDFDALRDAIGKSSHCQATSALDLNGQPFAAFIAADLNASGCATLLNGEQLTFLFTPQDDTEYMLAVAEIMASFQLE